MYRNISLAQIVYHDKILFVSGVLGLWMWTARFPRFVETLLRMECSIVSDLLLFCPQFLGVYTEVSHYIDFIQANTRR